MSKIEPVLPNTQNYSLYNTNTSNNLLLNNDLTSMYNPTTYYDHTDGITTENANLEPLYGHNFYIQPPQYNMLDSDESAYEYTKSYNKINNSQPSASNSNNLYPNNSLQSDHNNKLSSLAKDENIDPLFNNQFNLLTSSDNIHNNSSNNTSTIESKTINRSKNNLHRNRIITDTLPGPESCV